MPKGNTHLWHYRGRRLRQIEWGLWRDIDRKGYYFLRYRTDGRRGRDVRRWAYADGEHLTVKSLQQRVRQVRASIMARKLGQPLRAQARPALDRYVQDMERRNLAKSHVHGMRRSCERYVEAAKIGYLDQVSVTGVGAWLNRLHAAGSAPRTLNKHRAHLGTWFAWAVRQGFMADNPIPKIPTARSDRKLKAFPIPQDLVALADASTPYDAAVWTFLAFTGLRRGSFLSLSAECFGPEGIQVPHTKRRQEWFISFGDGCPMWKPELAELGRLIWSVREPTSDYMRFHLEDACKAAEIRRFTIHGFRHAFGSWLSLMGETYQDIAAWGHWASVKTVETYYAHLRPGGRTSLRANRRLVGTTWAHCLSRAMKAAD